ncbi:MAG: hypothetical protein AVDCRST_MAG24-1023, partial [uncultured Nocardioidaceae bacterium]
MGGQGLLEQVEAGGPRLVRAVAENDHDRDGALGLGGLVAEGAGPAAVDLQLEVVRGEELTVGLPGDGEGKLSPLGVCLGLLDDEAGGAGGGREGVEDALVRQEAGGGDGPVAGVAQLGGGAAAGALAAAGDAILSPDVGEALTVGRPARLGLVARLAGEVPAGAVVGVDDGDVVPLGLVGDVRDLGAVGRPVEAVAADDAGGDLLGLAGGDVVAEDMVAPLVPVDHVAGEGEPVGHVAPGEVVVVHTGRAVADLDGGAEAVGANDGGCGAVGPAGDEADPGAVLRPAGGGVDGRVVDKHADHAGLERDEPDGATAIPGVGGGESELAAVRGPLGPVGVLERDDVQVERGRVGGG